MQNVPPVLLTFFLEVKHNQTTPFWQHPILQPDSLPANISPESSDEVKENPTNEFEGSEDEDGDGDVVDIDSRAV